jgi:hypothetical protein
MAKGGLFEDANGKPFKVTDTKFIHRMKEKAAKTLKMGLLIGLLSSFAAIQVRSMI